MSGEEHGRATIATITGTTEHTAYLGIDVGGTKTLLASLDEHGVITQEIKFPTPQDYQEFLRQLADNLAKLGTHSFRSGAIGIPGVIDHRYGIGRSFSHLAWQDVAVQSDVEKITGCPMALENDAKLAGLSESMLVKDKRKVLYVTVSTGIGSGFIVDQHIDPELAGNEVGHILLEHHGKYQRWEDFAAGSAIVRQFGKPMSDIDDEATLKTVARNIALGLIDLTAVLTPDIIVIGGSVGTHFHKYGEHLARYMNVFDNPMIQLPVIQPAQRPEKAVVYGCYDLAKQIYG